MNFRWQLRIAAAGLALASRAAISQAMSNDSLECSGHLVSVGETLRGVLLECGAPTASQHHFYNSRRGRGSADQWTYERQGSFPRVLLFQNEILVSVVAVSRFRD